MIKSLLAFILFLSGLGLSQAQILKIIDDENGEPLEGVTIQSNDMEAFAVTNLYGEAEVSAFKGADLISIRSLSYENENLSYADLQKRDFKLNMTASSLQIEEVVVSASRWRQSSANVPNKITSIKKKDVHLHNPQTAADLLGISGKVFIQKSQQGGGSPMIRGFATNRLVYSIDGVRMNTAIFRGGNIQNVINVDPFSTEHTEVLFGPGSIMYGSDAIGGVMSFQTYGPQFSLDDKPAVSGNLFSRYSSANREQTAHVDVNLGFKRWAFYTSISHWDYDHLRQGRNGPDDYLKPYYLDRRNGEDVIIEQDEPLLQIPSAYSQLNLLQKVRFKASEKLQIDYAFHYSATSEYGRYDRHNRLRNGLPRYAEWKYGPQKWMMNLLTFKYQDSSHLYDEWRLRLAQQRFEESRISRDFDDPERTIREEAVDAWSLNFDANKSFGKRHTFFYGLELVSNQVSSNAGVKNINSGLTVDGADRYPQSDWYSAAVFLIDEYQMTEKLSLQTGARFNLFSLEADFSDNVAFYPLPYQRVEVQNEALSGSVGAVYRPNEKWVFKANLGTAFRAPNVDDLGKVFDSEPGAVVVPNPNLSAEYAYNLDLGMARVISEVVKVDLTAFYTILENAMVRRDFQLAGQDSISYDGSLSKVQALQNAAEATVYGLQAGLEVKFNSHLSWITDLNYQIGEEEMDDGSTSPSRHAAPFFGVSRLSFEKKQSRLQLYLQYQAEVAHENLSVEERDKTEIYALDAEGNTYAPAWYTLNLKFQQGINDFLTVGGGIENITDQRYRPYSSGISGAGRNYFLSLRASF